MMFVYLFFFKQNTAYDIRISDWSSDVCSSDLDAPIAMLARRGLGQWNVGEDIEFGSEIIGIGRQRADHRHRDASIVGAREIMALGGDRGEARFVPPHAAERRRHADRAADVRA